jgi:uncharacterized protein YcbX
MSLLSRISIFPIKSLDGVDVSAARILPSGAFEHDREYAIFDQRGKLVNGKRTAQVHQLRTSFDLNVPAVSLQAPRSGCQKTFHLDNDREELGLWLSDYFGFPVEIRHSALGLPDHGLTPGPSVTSTASLEKVSEWFDNISVVQARQRFRTNLEIAGVPAFWEDGLIGPNMVREFQIGDVHFEGVCPCERCVVPSHDPRTGIRYRGFQRLLATKRKETLPSWSPLSSFRHFYYFGVLTRVPVSETGKVLKVGDEVRLLGVR